MGSEEKISDKECALKSSMATKEKVKSVINHTNPRILIFNQTIM